MSIGADEIEKMTHEYILSRGDVTCEFSATLLDADVLDQLAKMNTVLQVAYAAPAKWVVYGCATCREDHGANHFHVELV